MSRSWMVLLLALVACSRTRANAPPRIHVDAPVARVLPSGAGAVYARIVNDGDGDDHLVAVESEALRDAQLHETVKDGDLTTMRRADSGFDVPAHGALVLEKGGKHVMMFGVRDVSAKTLPLTLRFARTGTVHVDVRLEPAMAATSPPSGSKRVLRVCADPNNLPFSNEKREGLEDALAALVAEDLGAELAYSWFPQRRGFLRATLRAHTCDVVMGVPAGSDMLATTKPYYRSGYAFVSRPGGPDVKTLGSPALAKMRIGMPLVGDDGANPSPAIALGRRGLAANLRGYSVFGDYREESPLADAIRALRRGEVDVAVAWGPVAGYFAKRDAPALRVALIPDADAPEGLPFSFSIAVGVRKDDTALRDELDAVLARRKQEVDAILGRFGVPRA